MCAVAKIFASTQRFLNVVIVLISDDAKTWELNCLSSDTARHVATWPCLVTKLSLNVVIVWLAFKQCWLALALCLYNGFVLAVS